MPRKTLAQRAQELGISLAVLNNAKTAGVNHWNDAEMAQWLGSRRPRVSAKKAKAKRAPAIDANEVTVEQLENEAKRAGDWQEVRTIKEKVTTLLQAQKFRRESGELLSRRDVEERDMRIAAAVKGALLKLSNDLPPMLEGLPANKIQKTIKAQMVGVLEQLASDQSEFWKERSTQ